MMAITELNSASGLIFFPEIGPCPHSTPRGASPEKMLNVRFAVFVKIIFILCSTVQTIILKNPDMDKIDFYVPSENRRKTSCDKSFTDARDISPTNTLGSPP